MNFALEVIRQPLPGQPIAMFALNGGLDASTVQHLEQAFGDAQLPSVGTRIIIVAMDGLRYVSSSGLRTLLAARTAMRKVGGDVLLCALSPAVRDIFDVVGFDAVFKIYDTREQALDIAKLVAGALF